jgi:hypothetical protein
VPGSLTWLHAVELARILITFCLNTLESGDAELQRAVKGSRDAVVR